MANEPQGESREYWRNAWSAMKGSEPHDVWYAVDETKMAYLRPYLPKSGRCLEVGCGSARLSRFLARRGFETVGVDFEPEAISIAARRRADDGLDVALMLGDAFALPFATGSFDVVLSTGLLEHFADPAPIVAEMTRVLRPGGLFYSDIVPRKFALMRTFDALMLRRRDLWERPFSKRQIADMLSRSGLSVRSVFAAGVLPPTLPLAGRWRTLARLQDRAAARFVRLARPLDGTKAAELLGIYYFACADKPVQTTDERVSRKRASVGKAA